MRRLTVFCSAILVTALPAGSGAADSETMGTVLVLETRSSGALSDAAIALTARIATEVARHSEADVVTTAELQDVEALQLTKELTACVESSTCDSKAIGNTIFEKLIDSSLGMVGKSFVITVTVIDSAKLQPVASASETAESLADISAAVPAIVARLFGDTGSVRKYQLPGDRSVSFAVFDLAPSGISAEVAQSLTEILAVEVKRVDRATVISRSDINAMLKLEQQKSILGCEDDTTCLAEIGGALGVDKLITGNIGKVAERFIITLRLIDARAIRVDNRYTESFAGEESQLIRATRHGARTLLGVEPDALGALSVGGSEAGAAVIVDGREMGFLPLPPLETLGVGRHSVRVSLNGFFDWRSDIYVDPRETTAVWATLQARPVAWYEEWWVWAVGGGVLIASATTLVLLSRDSEPKTGQVTVQLP